jgi:hypothetical protein
MKWKPPFMGHSGTRAQASVFCSKRGLNPALQRIATTPVLASERPAGFPHVKVTRLAADPRIHTLGIVRIDFSNSHASESASYALMRTDAAARRLAHTEATFKTAGLFHTRAVVWRGPRTRSWRRVSALTSEPF